MDKQNALVIFNLLNKKYPNARIALDYSNNWELLVAVILSAQSTDVQINKITKKLFKKYKNITDYANADRKEFENDIRSSGFFRNKAKNIIASAKIIVEKHNGKVPSNMKDLISLPGVARKTANIILGSGFGKYEGIAVDTHVKRLSQRIGLTKQKYPEKIEKDLMALYPKRTWPKLSYLLIEHGRTICNAKKPKCNMCFLNKICPSAFKFPHFNRS